MTTAQWQTAAAVIGTLIGIATIWYLRQSSSREVARLQEAAVQKRVDDATGPLREQIASLRSDQRDAIAELRDTARNETASLQRTIDRRDETIRALVARVNTLEDELRRGRGYGDNDDARQPPSG